MVPDHALDRFRVDLDPLIRPGERFGLAVSGGPDSLALLLLAAAARPGEVEAASVDHGLRQESRAEAEKVGDICETLGVPHTLLAISWEVPPGSAIQEQAREVRYGALAAWMGERGLKSVATGHHLDDQVETLIMRLNRGSGVRGLAGMRRESRVPGHPKLAVVRPLLGWHRNRLEEICKGSLIEPVIDPGNADQRFERVRIRKALAQAEWLDREALARSAGNLACADEAIDWAAAREWSEFVDVHDNEVIYRASTAPVEIIRRIVARVILELGSEGSISDLRGRELYRLIADLQASRTSTLRGVRCVGGTSWRFTRAAARDPR